MAVKNPRETFPPMWKVIPEKTVGFAKVEHFDVSESESRMTALHGGRSFVEAGRYARLLVRGELLMSDTPYERRTNRAIVEAATGRVLIAGLGLGMVLTAILQKRDVSDVVVVEKEPAGVDILSIAPEERALTGLFTAFQYPTDVAGVSNARFIEAALSARGLDADAARTRSAVAEQMTALGLDASFADRPVNADMSGGEKKRNEIVQLALLQPRVAVLDETDSGLDVDSLQIAANGINACRSKDRAFLIVTHYQRLLNYVVPNVVHVMVGGRIVKSGGVELAATIESRGYESVR